MFEAEEAFAEGINIPKIRGFSQKKFKRLKKI